MMRYYVSRLVPDAPEIVCARLNIEAKTYEYWLEPIKLGATMTAMHPRAMFTSIKEADDIIDALIAAGYGGDYRVRSNDHHAHGEWSKHFRVV